MERRSFIMSLAAMATPWKLPTTPAVSVITPLIPVVTATRTMDSFLAEQVAIIGAEIRQAWEQRHRDEYNNLTETL